jgi:hypothetical protein
VSEYDDLTPAVLSISQRTDGCPDPDTWERKDVAGYTHPDVPGLGIHAQPYHRFPTTYGISHLHTGHAVLTGDNRSWYADFDTLGDAFDWLLKLGKVMDWTQIKSLKDAKAVTKERRRKIKKLRNEYADWKLTRDADDH